MSQVNSPTNQPDQSESPASTKTTTLDEADAYAVAGIALGAVAEQPMAASA